jgi:hypothetical protein
MKFTSSIAQAIKFKTWPSQGSNSSYFCSNIQLRQCLTTPSQCFKVTHAGFIFGVHLSTTSNEHGAFICITKREQNKEFLGPSFYLGRPKKKRTRRERKEMKFAFI